MAYYCSFIAFNMPFQLFLLRHAETELQQAGQSDFDRQLLQKGHDQIGYLAQKLTRIHFHTDSIICSPAMRAKTTALSLLSALNINSDYIQFDQAIYSAEVAELFEIIKETKDNCRHLLVIGHNPTLSDLVTNLVKGFADGLRTCDFISIELNVDHWSDIHRGVGKLKEIIHAIPV